MRVAIGELGRRFEFNSLQQITHPIVDLLPPGGFFMQAERSRQVVLDGVNRVQRRKWVLEYQLDLAAVFQ